MLPATIALIPPQRQHYCREQCAARQALKSAHKKGESGAATARTIHIMISFDAPFSFVDADCFHYFHYLFFFSFLSPMPIIIFRFH